jgi:hypothetical protein
VPDPPVRWASSVVPGETTIKSEEREKAMDRDEEAAARYRRAAQLALGQLEWCVEYLRRIHKNRLARQLAKNHAAISRRLRDNADGAGHA